MIIRPYYLSGRFQFIILELKQGLEMQNKRLSIKKANIRWFAIAFLIVSFIILIYLSPTEKTLGANVKLIYLHASMIWTALLLFIVSLVVLGVGLIQKKKKYLNKGKRIFITGSIALAINLALSMISMQIIWQKIAWQEPRFKNMVTAFFLLIICFALAAFFEKTEIKSSLYIIASLSVLLLIMISVNVIHPASAIRDSGSLAIKFFPLAMTGLLFTTGMLISGGDSNEPLSLHDM